MALTKDGILNLKTEGFKEAETRLKQIGRSLERAAALTGRLTQQSFNLGTALTLVAGRAVGASKATRAAFQHVTAAAQTVSDRLTASYVTMLQRTAQAAEAGRAVISRNLDGLATAADKAGTATARALSRGIGTGAGGGAAASIVSGITRGMEALKAGARSLAVSLGALGAGTFGVFKLLQAGERVQNVSAAFQRFAVVTGGAARTLDALARATGGGVSNTNLMLAANRLLAAQLGISRDRMAALFGAGTRLGRALGFTATEAIERMSLALSKQEPELLDELGIKVDLTKAIQAYARANGVAAESIDAQTRARIFLEAVEAQAQERVKGLGAGTLSAAAASEILSAKWSNLTDRFTVMLATTPGVFEGLQAIGEAAIGLVNALAPVVQKIAELVAWMAKFKGMIGALFGGAAGGLAGLKVGAGIGSAFGPIGTIIGGGIGLAGGTVLGGLGGFAAERVGRASAGGAESGAASAGLGPAVQLNVTQTVPIHDGSVERVAAAAGRQLAKVMHRRMDSVRSDVETGLERGLGGMAANGFELA